MSVGMILEPDQANEIIKSGKSDLIALGREALYNPNWVLHAYRKYAKENNFDEWPPNVGWWLEVRQRMLKSSDPKDWKVGKAANNTFRD